MTRGIVGGHQRQTQRVDPVTWQGQADQAPAMGGHKVDRVGGAHLCRDHQIALILAVFVIDQNEHLSVARGLDDLFHR